MYIRRTLFFICICPIEFVKTVQYRQFLVKFVNKTSFKNKDSESLHAVSYYLEHYLVKFALTDDATIVDKQTL